LLSLNYIDAQLEGLMIDRECHIKLEIPNVPRSGYTVYLEDEKRDIRITSVGDRLGNDPARFDVVLEEGCRAVAYWVPHDERSGTWRAVSKGPAPAT